MKHQFLFPAVISAIAISAKQSYTKSRDCIKIVTYGVEYYTMSTRILGISLGISSHKHGTVACADLSLS